MDLGWPMKVAAKTQFVRRGSPATNAHSKAKCWKD